MKKKTKILIYVITFIVVFLISALIRIMLLGSAPERLIKVEWDESVGEIYSNLDYENDNGSIKVDKFNFDIDDVSGSTRLCSDLMKRLGIKLDSDELYEEF